MNSNLRLKSVTKADCPFLYELLHDRDPSVNISHKKMPSYDKHIKFVMSKPYSKWYVIQYDDQKVGSIYLSKQNEIGIFIKKEKQNEGIGGRAMKLLLKKNPRSRYLANVNPKNKKSMSFFKKNGFKLIQYTYELTNSTNH
ncbi:MAG: GNAT family N-acetyltransferase [Patescibacteria group bacterium]|nr:GNAT family N-acetyltransferase [Patescibacteria group bacterium]